jgi:hypothetical protein
MRKLLLISTLSLALATQASAQSFLRKLGDRLGERVTNAVTSGQLPEIPSSAAGATVSSSTGFQRYGAWDFKLDRLERGADDAWQAVIAVRNAAQYRQGMVASEINLFLITEDGETLHSWGELYKASVEGSAAGLEPVPGTLWLEPGDMTRVRLRFEGSRGTKPAKLRIQSTGATSQSRTFPVAG